MCVCVCVCVCVCLRNCAENRCLRSTTVSDIMSICCQPDDLINKRKLNPCSRCAVITE